MERGWFNIVGAKGALEYAWVQRLCNNSHGMTSKSRCAAPCFNKNRQRRITESCFIYARCWLNIYLWDDKRYISRTKFEIKAIHYVIRRNVVVPGDNLECTRGVSILRFDPYALFVFHLCLRKLLREIRNIAATSFGLEGVISWLLLRGFHAGQYATYNATRSPEAMLRRHRRESCMVEWVGGGEQKRPGFDLSSGQVARGSRHGENFWRDH